MRVPIEDDFLAIARDIVAERLSEAEWAAIESGDMFQRGNYAGGFEALEMEFCFSYFGAISEIWFQLSLTDVKRIASGDLVSVEGRPAEE